MITYHVKLTEREMEILITALALQVEDDAGSGHDEDAKEAHDLMVRLDVAADEQFLTAGQHKT